MPFQEIYITLIVAFSSFIFSCIAIKKKKKILSFSPCYLGVLVYLYIINDLWSCGESLYIKPGKFDNGVLFICLFFTRQSVTCES